MPLNDVTLQLLSIHVLPDSFISRCSLVSLNRGVRRPSSREGTHALACSSIKNKALPLAASSGPASRGAVEWSVRERAVHRYYSCSVLGTVCQCLFCPLRDSSTTHFPVRWLYIVIYHGQWKEFIVVL